MLGIQVQNKRYICNDYLKIGSNRQIFRKNRIKIFNDNAVNTSDKKIMNKVTMDSI